MGPVKLPFNGTNKGLNDPLPSPLPTPDAAVSQSQQIFRPEAGGVQADTTLYVGIAFNVPVGGGKVILIVPSLSGKLTFESFERNGASKMIAVPFTETGVWIYHIQSSLKGHVLIATSN